MHTCKYGKGKRGLGPATTYVTRMPTDTHKSAVKRNAYSTPIKGNRYI